VVSASYTSRTHTPSCFRIGLLAIQVLPFDLKRQHLGVPRSAAHTCRHTCCSATEGHGSPALCKSQLSGTHVLHHWMHTRACKVPPAAAQAARRRLLSCSRRAALLVYACKHKTVTPCRLPARGPWATTHNTRRWVALHSQQFHPKSACAAPTCTGCAGTRVLWQCGAT
jgi:hypothetical protein